jgi:hypothetical protein
MYYDCLNSYAVELGEAGRLYEARNVCDLVLASPFAFAYSEWQQTAEDLRGASRSRIGVQSVSNKAKLFYLPTVERNALEERSQPGPHQSLACRNGRRWGKAGRDHNDRLAPERATEKDLYLRLISLIAKKDLPSKQLCEIIEFVEKLPSRADCDAEQD